ncbi:hypothetical protein [Maribacter halichondriae]|nr:hypothetical protein [Maribacter sp. Hal144]
MIEKLIKEEWGGFTVGQDNLMQQGVYNFDMPYTIIEKYTKI